MLDTILAYPEKITIGDNVTCGGRVMIDATSDVIIGNNCMIGWGAIITTAKHDPTIEIMNTKTLSDPVNIGNNVWIGAGVIILPGVNIADGVIIGAGAVVTRSIDDENVIVGGIPAKIIAKRTIKTN